MNWIKWKVGLILLCIVLLAASFALDIIGEIRPIELAVRSEGSPILIKRENDFLSTGISQIVSDGNQLYVLFGTYGVVQVYSAEGAYQYSISVYRHMNGMIEIAEKDGCLYIRDKLDNIYVFSNGEFLEYIEWVDSTDITKSMQFGVSDPQYTIKGSSIWRTADDLCVLNRPGWLAIYQGSTNWLIKVLLIILCASILLLPTKKKKTGDKV